MTNCAGCGTELPPSRSNRPRKWCSERCRKNSYGDPCVDCGIRTAFGAEAPRVPMPRCIPCAAAHRTVWTREALLAIGAGWVQEFGEPPAIKDWWTATARRIGNDHERAARYHERHATGSIPHAQTVMRVFGSWGAYMLALGFAPRPAHGGGGNELRRRSMRQKVGAA